MSKIANDGLTRSGTGCTHMVTVGVKVANPPRGWINAPKFGSVKRYSRYYQNMLSRVFDKLTLMGCGKAGSGGSADPHPLLKIEEGVRNLITLISIKW